MKIYKIPTILALCAMPFAASYAETVTFNDTVTLLNDTDAVINLSQFDNGVGGVYEGATLNSVTVTFRVDVSGANVQVDNDSLTSKVATARVLNTVNSLTSTASLEQSTGFSSPVGGADGGNLNFNETQIFNLDATINDTIGQFDAQVGEGDYASWSPGTLSESATGTIASSLNSDYEGAASVAYTINATYLSSASFEGEDGYFQGNTPSGEFFVSVVYDYTAAVVVPEPGTYALIAGLFAFTWMAVRRRK